MCLKSLNNSFLSVDKYFDDALKIIAFNSNLHLEKILKFETFVLKVS